MALGEKARLRSSVNAEAGSAMLSDAQMKTATTQQLQGSAMRQIYSILGSLGRVSTRTESTSAGPQIAALEQTVVSLVQRARLTPGMQKFAAEVFSLTNNKMKPKLVARYNTLKTHVGEQMPAFQTCTDSLVAGYRTANAKWNSLPTLKNGLDKCVLDLVCDAGLCNAASSMSSVNWEIVNIALKSHVNKSELSGYVTGTWERCDSFGVQASNATSSASLLQSEIMVEDASHQTVVQRMLAQSQCQPGMTAALTAYTCEKKSDVCKDFMNANSYHDFDDCSSTYPVYANVPGGYSTAGVAPENCTELGGACCKNPDSRECDKFQSVNSSASYSSVGSYKFAMFKYWSNMIKLYDDAERSCQQWCDWCSGNQTLCPIDPPNTRCAVVKPKERPDEPVSLFGPAPTTRAPTEDDDDTTTTTTTTTTTAVRPEVQLAKDQLRCKNCTAEQDLLDMTACEASQLASKTCNDYKLCYTEANTSLSAAFKTVCAPGGDLSIIKNEYYGVMRIECLVNALKAEPSDVRNQINICINKTIADYDMSLFKIDGCDSGWPEYMASQNEMCMTMMSVATHQNVSGTMAYQQKWYRDIPNRKMCTAACCLSRPEDYRPPLAFAVAG